MRAINKSHFALYGNFIEWHDKESLGLTGEMRLTPKVGDKLIDGVDEYKFIVVSECVNNRAFYATVELCNERLRKLHCNINATDNLVYLRKE